MLYEVITEHPPGPYSDYCCRWVGSDQPVVAKGVWRHADVDTWQGTGIDTS